MSRNTAREFLIEHNKQMAFSNPEVWTKRQSELTAAMIREEDTGSDAAKSAAWWHDFYANQKDIAA